jgi:Domain of unknown function (DUF4251)
MATKIKNCTIVISAVLLIVFSITNVFCQEKSKKQIKEAKKLEKQKQIALLVESKEFVFNVRRVIPQGGQLFNPTSPYSVEFKPELVNSHLPYIGRGFGGIGYGGDEGMIFEGKPSVFSVEKTKKGYQIKTEVQGKNDTFTMLLIVYSEGNGYLTINSNNRSPISYDGDIEAFKTN